MNNDEILASEDSAESLQDSWPMDGKERSGGLAVESELKRKRLFALIGFCGLVFFVADLLTPTCFEAPFPAMLALGVVTAQLTVICVWGTLVRGTFWLRLPWTMLLLVVSWQGLAWGSAFVTKTPSTSVILGIGFVWIFGFVTSYIPLKIAAICFRWQIIDNSAQDRTNENTSRYAIRDMMLGTLFLALMLAIGRAMLPSDEINFQQALASSGLNRSEPRIAIALYGVISLLVKLPCIWIALGEKKEMIKSRIWTWAAYCFGLSIFEVLLLTALVGNIGGISGELFVGLVLSHQLMGGIMLLVCLTLRGLGYRLERSNRAPKNQRNSVRN